jgi:DNA-binding transcriptional ArsR family regulator
MTADRVPPHPDVRTVTLQDVLEALADPVRRSIVAQLYGAEDDVSCGAFGLSVTKSTATHHFKVLREAGLIRQWYVGTSRMNRLRREEFDAVFPGLLDAVVAAELGRGRRPAPVGAAI